MEQRREALDPRQAIAARVKEARTRRGWTAQALADRCAAAGMPGLDRSTLAKIEAGRRQRIGVEELLTLAYVLDVAPVHLLVPIDEAGEYRVTPAGEVFDFGVVRDWVRGFDGLPESDGRMYRSEVPAHEFGVPRESTPARRGWETRILRYLLTTAGRIERQPDGTRVYTWELPADDGERPTGG